MDTVYWFCLIMGLLVMVVSCIGDYYIFGYVNYLSVPLWIMATVISIMTLVKFNVLPLDKATLCMKQEENGTK